MTTHPHAGPPAINPAALRALALLITPLLVLAALASPASAQIEDYASYEPQTRCSPQPKPGTVYLQKWTVRHYGGGRGRIGERCGGGTSEHQEGRAFDWTIDAATKKGRRAARALLARIFAANAAGEDDAWARRMGLMYVIWDDHIYSAWRQFEPERYKASSCKTLKKCSKTLRHRDHLHVSMTRAGGKGRTSWFEGRLD